MAPDETTDETPAWQVDGNPELPLAEPAPDAEPDRPPPPLRILEALLFVGGEPLTAARACEAIRGLSAAQFDQAVHALNRDYRLQGRPYGLRRQGQGFVLALRPHYKPVLDKLYGAVRAARLSPVAVDVLALVAYRQPATKQEIDGVRGAESGAILRQLVRHGLIAVVQRGDHKQREVSYGTTPRFLELFALQSLDDLPRPGFAETVSARVRSDAVGYGRPLIMLTGKLVRVRYGRDRILPSYLDTTDAGWLAVAENLLELFRGQEGRTRGELDAEIRDLSGNDPSQLAHQGLAKLLEDRCDFEVVSGHPPEQLREAVFLAAARRNPPAGNADAAWRRPTFDRERVLREVGETLGLTAEAVDQGLFADLKSEQRLVAFKDITSSRLLERYNVALAQAILLRSTRVHVQVRAEPPARYRQLFRLVKFHRLVCELERTGPDSFCLHLDGPLSLFTATQKYGLQLALFLPAVLLCRDFDLMADLHWGPQRKPKKFMLSSKDGLVSHALDYGTYTPPELAMFVELFRKKVADWEIVEDVDVVPLGESFWVPDYCLVHKESGRRVYLEVLGFWRRSSVERHLERLRQHVREPFLLAMSDRLRVDDAELEGLPAGIHRFRQLPLPDEVARLAGELITGSIPGPS